MNKNDYLKELDRELERRMPEQEREDTLRYYTEYFEEAGPEREAQVIEELGAPDALARRLAEEGGWTEAKKQGWSRGAVIATAVAVVLLVAAVCIGGCIAIRRAAEILAPPHPISPSPSVSTPPSPGVSHSPAVSTPPQTQGPETPPPQTASPSPSQGAQPTQPLDDGFLWVPEAFTRVEADIPLGDLTLRAEGDTFRVEAKFGGTTHGEAYRIECELTDGTLDISGFPKSINQTGSDRKCYAEVTVTVPEGTLLDRVELNTALGDIDLCLVHAGSVDAHTALGDVWVSGAAADTITLRTNLGDVDGKDLDTDSLTMKSNMGDVRLEGAPAADMELHTDLGEIDAELACSAGDCSYALSTNLGTCSVDGSGQGKSARQNLSGAAYRLDAHSNMGAVKLSFSG